jgi:predicted RNA binding protein YcfA (HicA-like mRNA interferase family)
MPKPRVLSGRDLIKIFAAFGFEFASQRGSHMKMSRVLATGTKQTLTIPNHREIDRGTLLAIYRQALRFLTAEELAPHFFTE